ncbi:hypothetical protein D3C86_1514240 [compost metagenome]
MHSSPDGKRLRLTVFHGDRLFATEHFDPLAVMQIFAGFFIRDLFCKDIHIVAEPRRRAPRDMSVVAKHQARIGEWRVAGDVIARAVQPDAVGIRRGIPAKLRAVDHDGFRVLRLFLANHPHVAGRRVPGQTVGTAAGKLFSDRFAVLPGSEGQQRAVIAFGRAVEHRCGEIVARE